MKHCERERAALSDERPERWPMQIRLTPELAARLREDLAIMGEPLHTPHGGYGGAQTKDGIPC